MEIGQAVQKPLQKPSSYWCHWTWEMDMGGQQMNSRSTLGALQGSGDLEEDKGECLRDDFPVSGWKK